VRPSARPPSPQANSPSAEPDERHGARLLKAESAADDALVVVVLDPHVLVAGDRHTAGSVEVSRAVSRLAEAAQIRLWFFQEVGAGVAEDAVLDGLRESVGYASEKAGAARDPGVGFVTDASRATRRRSSWEEASPEATGSHRGR